ncbi:hypothetical protein EBX93_05400, partial [bacterium]|nr:hypothetical protein [bacterium]
PCYSKCFCFNSFPTEPTLRQAQGPVFFPQGPGAGFYRSVSLSNCQLKNLATVNAFASTHFLLNRPFDKLRVRFFSAGAG